MLCDFDGTITVQDTAEWMLDKHAEGDWRALDDCYVQGKISLLECMREQFAMVKVDKALMLDELDENITLRKGFSEMVDLSLKDGAQVIIVSAGLDFVIEHFLKRLGVESKVTIYSASTFDDDGHIGFKFPALVMPGSRTFKDDLVLQFKKKRYQVSYFGDGMPDAEACAISDHRFAVKGKRLEAELSRRSLPFMSFEDFHEVMSTLKRFLDA